MSVCGAWDVWLFEVMEKGMSVLEGHLQAKSQTRQTHEERGPTVEGSHADIGMGSHAVRGAVERGGLLCVGAGGWRWQHRGIGELGVFLKLGLNVRGAARRGGRGRRCYGRRGKAQRGVGGLHSAHQNSKQLIERRVQITHGD